MKAKRLSRRDFLKGGSLILGSAALAHCAPATPAETPPAAQPAAPTSAPPRPAPSDTTYESWISNVASTDPLEVRIVHWFDPNNPAEHNQELMDFVTAEWKKRYPNGTIHWELVGWGEIDQRTPGFVLANEPVDISYNWGGATANWCAQGILLPMDNQMPRWWVDTRIPAIFQPPANDLCPDGSLVMIAFGLENQAIVLRKDVMETAGVDPATLTTYDGFLAGLRRMAEQPGFEKPYGLKLGADWSTMDSVSFLWLGNGLTFGDFREDGSEREAWIQAAEFIKALMELTPEAALNWTWAEAEQAYAMGQIAALDHGNWFYSVGAALDPEAQIVNPSKTTLCPYPIGPSSPEQQPFHSFSLTGFYRLKTSPEGNTQAVADLLAILTRTQTVWMHNDGTNPPTTDWTTADRLQVAYDPAIEWWWRAWDAVKANSRMMPYQGFLARDEITSAAYPLLVSMYRGELTPEGLYTQVRELALPLIEAARA